MPPPKYKTTPEHQKLVEKAAAVGLTAEQIAKVIGCAESTLWKYYKNELSTAGMKANISVAAALYKKCMEGNVTAQIFWCKTRLGWKEKVEHEVSGEVSGNSVQPVINLTLQNATSSDQSTTS